jgi:biopolymer transport protein ExbD
MALKRRNRVEATFAMSSMTDLIFLLLLFFVMASTMSSPNDIKLNLPTSRANTATKQVVAKVSKEDKEALINASSNKQIVSYLVDQYYQSQSYRIRGDNQARAVLQGFDEADRGQFTFIQKEKDNAKAQEALNKKYMDIVTDSIPVCRWMKSITGIGPVISAYLYSVFDVKAGKYNTNFLSYAGLNDNNNPYKKECYYLAKCLYGDLVGYKLTDLTYCNSSNANTQELIGKAGETLTSILDKIKNMLVYFEYFYDINGKFVF